MPGMGHKIFGQVKCVWPIPGMLGRLIKEHLYSIVSYGALEQR